MNYCETKTKEHLEYNQLLEEFVLGCKTDKKIGLEYERIPLIKVTNQVAKYDGEYGICEMLREFAKTDNWDYILDDVNIIGLKKIHDTITLEPGCQVELSLEPQEFIRDLKKRVEEIDSVMQPILDKFGIKLINKDAMKKFRIANIMMPFATAMYANSRYRGGVDTGYKSFRALAWLNTDNERCGFATKFHDGMSFKDYVETLLDTPMIFINRENRTVNLNGRLTFRQFMNKGFEGFDADIDDWKLHANLYFPEVRLRNFIEIRNHDCVGGGLEYSIPAFYKGIMYNSAALDEVSSMLLKYSYNEINELRYNVARHATASKLRKHPILNICKELVEISYYSLKNQCEDEEIFLEPLMEMLKKNKVPCDFS